MCTYLNKSVTEGLSWDTSSASQG